MGNELELRPVVGGSLSEVKALGAIFKASGYFKDIRDETQAITKILYGRELGFTPIVSIMGIYIVDGKPSLSANLLATMVKRSGKYDYRVKANTNTECVLEFRTRNDDGKWEVCGDTEFTMKDAVAAGVGGKDVWKRYPKAMLFARAMSAGVRAHCPDVSACPIYVPEELGATVNEDGDVLDMPVSKPAVAVTTEPIPIRKVTPIVHANPDDLDDGGISAATLAGLQKPTAAQLFDAQATKGADAAARPTVMDSGVTYINLNKQRYIHRAFRDALPESLQPHADKLLGDWLNSKGLVKDGKPSTKMIEDGLFDEIVKDAIAFAEGLK